MSSGDEIRREPGHVKRAPRVDALHCAMVIKDDGQVSEVSVTNVSDVGCRIEGRALPGIGEVVTLHVDGRGKSVAKVRWSFGMAAGLVFIDPEGLTLLAS